MNFLIGILLKLNFKMSKISTTSLFIACDFSYMSLECHGGLFELDGETFGDTFDFECLIAKVFIITFLVQF